MALTVGPAAGEVKRPTRYQLDRGREGAVIESRKRRSSPPALVALVGFIVVVLMVVRGLMGADWDPTIFVGFGEDANATRQYAEERLGEIVLRPYHGHDGKYFFVQANDPWLIAPGENAEILDFPRYRSQRMLYPMLAGGFGALEPVQIAWSLMVVNVVAMALGTWGSAALARRMGGSPWLGLAFALNIGFISVIIIDGAGILAAAAALWAVAVLLNGRSYWAIGLLAAAGLTREVFLLAAAGAAWWLWKRGRRQLAVAAALIPALVVGVWALYVRVRLDGDEASAHAIGWPLVGLAKAVPEWIGNPFSLLAGFGMILVLVLYARRLFLSDSLLGWTFLGFVPLAILFTERVWEDYFDFTRALAPLITGFVLMAFAGSGAGQRGGVDPESEERSARRASTDSATRPDQS